MKKFLSMLLLFVILLNAVAIIVVSADEADEISYEEAERLSFEASRILFRMIKNDDGYREVNVDFYKGYFLFRSTNYVYFDSYVEQRSGTDYIKVQTKEGYDWSYYKVEKLAEPFKSITVLDNYVKTVYHGKALEAFTDEMIYVEHDGNIYWRYNGGDGWYGRDHRLLLCNNFVSNGDGKAVMNVVFGKYGGPAMDYAEDKIPALNTSYAKQRGLLIPINATVEFTKTADGWRVSGGSLLEMISNPSTIPNNWDYKPYVGDTPFTGDETSILLALLALSGIALVCVPAVKRRKR